MLLTLGFGFLNALLSFIGDRLVRFSGFDLAPGAIIILGMRGDSIFWGAIILVLAYSLVTPKELRYIWLTLPLTMAIGFLALLFPFPSTLIIIYHIIGLIMALLLRYFGFRYVIFMIINISLNLFLVNSYTHLIA